MFFWRLKRVLALAAAVLVAVGAFAFVRAVNVGKFQKLAGERTYYLYSASAQALQKQTLRGWDIFLVKGESVRLEKTVDQEFVYAIIEEYGGELLFVEDACGVLSYYAYTPLWKEGVCVAGKTVNLHIAVREGACVVGSPIIFGGF